MIPKVTKKQLAKIRQMYNHANVLHNVAWEAEYAFHKEIDKLFLKCESVKEWQELRSKMTELIHCKLWNCPDNPKPNRPVSHSGNIDMAGFYTYSYLEEMREKEKNKA